MHVTLVGFYFTKGLHRLETKHCLADSGGLLLTFMSATLVLLDDVMSNESTNKQDQTRKHQHMSACTAWMPLHWNTSSPGIETHRSQATHDPDAQQQTAQLHLHAHKHTRCPGCRTTTSSNPGGKSAGHQYQKTLSAAATLARLPLHYVTL